MDKFSKYDLTALAVFRQAVHGPAGGPCWPAGGPETALGRCWAADMNAMPRLEDAPTPPDAPEPPEPPAPEQPPADPNEQPISPARRRQKTGFFAFARPLGRAFRIDGEQFELDRRQGSVVLAQRDGGLYYVMYAVPDTWTNPQRPVEVACMDDDAPGYTDW